MNIVCLGGGPAGLYFGLLMKLRHPEHKITVLERNKPYDTFGWGVVFSDATMSKLQVADPVTASEILGSFNHWDDIAVHFKGETMRSGGHGFCGIGRKRLLNILQKRCEELGVELVFEAEVDANEDLAARYNADLVIACDGINSKVRTRFAKTYKPDIDDARESPALLVMEQVAKKGGTVKKLDGRGAKDMPAMMGAKPGSGVVTNNVANGMLKDPGAVKVFISTWSNFAFSATGAQRWEKALAAIPFFVHMVPNASEMTQFADIVLPSTFNSAEGWSIVTNMGNGHAYASIQQGAVKRLWDVKQEETEVMWLLAEKLKARGFANLFDYYAKEFKDPETGKAPTTALEFSEIAAKISEKIAAIEAKYPVGVVDGG